MSSICEGELTSLAFCWTVERSDGAGIAVTSHDQSLSSDNLIYSPEPAITPGSITRSLGLEPHAAELSGALSAEALTPQDLSLGRWDGARIRSLAIDWSAPAEGPTLLLAGELGEVSTNDDGFTVEVRGAAAKLAGPACPVTSAQCRAEFGDRQCRVDLAGRSRRATVVSSTDNLIVTDVELSSDFVFGRLRYLSGPNCGLQTVVLATAGAQLTVRDRPRAAVEAGTVLELRQGCDKRFETCVSRFANAENFRGEPHLPGNDLLTRYPGA